MTNIIITKKCVIGGKHLSAGSLISTSDAKATLLINQGYGIKQLPKQNVQPGAEDKKELSIQSDSEVQKLPVSKKLQTTVSKSKQIKK